ncbi:polysaccharide deacetylase family protein [Affinirhizobium pseudoryzae]|uniref:polysaccharide deacetylase family protein n=1 Tax=Allorhizobium pseudoryzae TaxID=379684 RepID=UPI0013EDCA62|nr:polysaccharide deacetylase family protein [Allorhizobium pseudoryzae]
MSETQVMALLDHLADQGKVVNFWLRDDDAVLPTPALDRLLTLTRTAGVPLTLAVIPEQTGQPLVDCLRGEPHVAVAVHGWSHRNHAPPQAKNQELGLHRPIDEVLGELKHGLEKLDALHGPQFLSMLVPPWNRIAPEIVERLPALGFGSLSVFGREKPAPLPVLNTHIDIMDWRGTRGGHPSEVLFGDILAYLESDQPVRAIGVLTHHLVHDEQAWAFLERLFERTAGHPACRWAAAADLIGN